MSNQSSSFRLRLVFVALSGLLYTNVTRADSLDTWNVTYARSMAHHSNVRFNNADGGSDNVTIDTLGLKVNKSYSLQRFELDVNLAKSSYQKQDRLDFNASNHAAAWRWSLTPSLRGNLISSREVGRADSSSELFTCQSQNVRTKENQRFDTDFDLGAGYHLLGGVFRTQMRNSHTSCDERDNTLRSAELGGRYDFTSGSSVGFISRAGSGTYDNQPEPMSGPLLDNAFQQTENMVTLNWPLTGKTRINGRLGYFARKHDHYAARDYSGTVGALNMDWEISGKSRLSSGLTRNLASYEANSSSYSTIDRFFFSPVWQMSTRTALRLRYEFIKQDYQGAVGPSVDAGRRDIKRIGLLSMDWQPMDSISLSASLTEDRRTSNQAIGKFKDTVAQISVQVGF